MTEHKPAIVRLDRIFAATAERVFDAWLTPDVIGQWMFGPLVRDEELLGVSVDARVGGHFSFRVRRQGAEVDHVGHYLELDRPRRLAFTWGIGEDALDASRVAIEIESLPEGCRLQLTHELHPDWPDYKESAAGGWTLMLGKLDALLG